MGLIEAMGVYRIESEAPSKPRKDWQYFVLRYLQMRGSIVRVPFVRYRNLRTFPKLIWVCSLWLFIVLDFL